MSFGLAADRAMLLPVGIRLMRARAGLFDDGWEYFPPIRPRRIRMYGPASFDLPWHAAAPAFSELRRRRCTWWATEMAAAMDEIDAITVELRETAGSSAWRQRSRDRLRELKRRVRMLEGLRPKGRIDRARTARQLAALRPPRVAPPRRRREEQGPSPAEQARADQEAAEERERRRVAEEQQEARRLNEQGREVEARAYAHYLDWSEAWGGHSREELAVGHYVSFSPLAPVDMVAREGGATWNLPVWKVREAFHALRQAGQIAGSPDGWCLMLPPEESRGRQVNATGGIP